VLLNSTSYETREPGYLSKSGCRERISMASSSGLPYLQNQHNPFLETEIQYSATQAHLAERNMWKRNLYLAKKNLFSVIHLPIIGSLNVKSLPSHSSLKTLASLSVINCTAQRDNAHVAVMPSFTSDLNYFCAFAFIQFLLSMQDKTQDTLRVFFLTISLLSDALTTSISLTLAMEVEMGRVVDGTDVVDPSNSEVLLFQKNMRA
jgi:hypothetical protein